MTASDYALVVASHNRRETTLSFLRQVETALQSIAGRISIYLLDDGSTDGTSDAVKENFPSVEILHGDGTLFWNRSMTRLIDYALRNQHENIILANDDIRLDHGALTSAVEIFENLNSDRPAVLVGAFRDLKSGATTYSGMSRVGASPLGLIQIPPAGRPVPCDTFNGNFVIVPASALSNVGGLDPRFQHAYGDLDLGYRLGQAGVPSYVAPDHLGSCERGPSIADRLKGRDFPERLRLVFGRTRSPHDHALLLWKHAPLLAPALFLREVFTRLGLALITR